MVTREQLHFYCQKVLPLAYDDSLSYYEVLAKLTKKVNELVLSSNIVIQNLQVIIRDYLNSDDFQNLWKGFLTGNLPDYTYVQHYMDWLGLSAHSAITEAIKDCPLHGTVYFPRRKVTVSSPIIINKPICLQGNYTGWIFDESRSGITADEYQEFDILSSASAGIQITTPGVTTRNLSIYMFKSTEDQAGILINPGEDLESKAMRYVNLEHVFVKKEGNLGFGIYMANLLKSTFYDVSTYWGKYGFYHAGTETPTSTTVTNGTSLTFLNCWAVAPAYHGYHLKEVYYSSLINCATDGFGPGEIGYYLENCKGLSIVSCGTENMKENAVRMMNCAGCDVLFTSAKGHAGYENNEEHYACYLSGCDGIRVSGFIAENQEIAKHTFLGATDSLFEITASNAKYVTDEGARISIGGRYSKVFEIDKDKLFPNNTFTGAYIIYANGILHGYINTGNADAATYTALATLSANARIQYLDYFIAENRITKSAGVSIVTFDCASTNVRQLWLYRKTV